MWRKVSHVFVLRAGVLCANRGDSVRCGGRDLRT
jgi:hypothetical protein